MQAETLEFVDAPPRRPQETFAAAVESGLSLTEKTLPSRFFYDTRGSQLFELITDLPEYYLTRTERALLEDYAPEIVGAVGDAATLVEFGSGSGCKTRLLLAAFLARQPALHYVPIDISRDFLRSSARALLTDYEGLSITAIAAEYNDGLDALPPRDGPRLLIFLGSNIGNFTPEEAQSFLARIRSRMNETDRLLVGMDLAKNRAELEAAYNDAQGVTEAFNKNLLARINRELDGAFDLDAFAHCAPFDEAQSRIEMRLVSRVAQDVPIRALARTFHFAAGESVHTENSYKYTPARFATLAERAGLQTAQSWVDSKERFALALLRAPSA